MIDNIDIAYCMAKLEDKIRWEWYSAKIYLDCCDGLKIRCMKELLLGGQL